MATPTKISRGLGSQISETCRVSENSDPNVTTSTPSKKPIKSPTIKSASKKSAPRTPNHIVPPPPPSKERKFVMAKKNSRKGGNDLDVCKSRQAAYDSLLASQEDFFRKDNKTGSPRIQTPSPKEADGSISIPGTADSATGDSNVQDLDNNLEARKMRIIALEEALTNIPEPGSGRVRHLVKAFESLLSISEEDAQRTAEKKKWAMMSWTLPGLQQPAKGSECEVSSTDVLSSMELFPSWDFERDSRMYSSIHSEGDRLSLESRTSSGGRKSRRNESRRNSTDSCGRSWNKKLKVTNQHPFKLRTEQRGRLKEEHFIKKVKEMLWEEEKKRIPIAQGLPWTTDEPEVLVKPPVKESTEPIDLVLHSDVRAVERAEFDHHIAQRLSLAEQMRLERERQQKLEEEEEVRRLRRELVPRAQPMPYFDRPFIPKKSRRHRTVPKEPRFHIRPTKPQCILMLER